MSDSLDASKHRADVLYVQFSIVLLLFLELIKHEAMLLANKVEHVQVIETHGQLVEVNSVEGEVLVIDWVQGSSNYSSLHLGTLGQILREQNSAWEDLCRKVIRKYGTSIGR